MLRHEDHFIEKMVQTRTYELIPDHDWKSSERAPLDHLSLAYRFLFDWGTRVVIPPEGPFFTRILSIDLQ
jgi:hypothetical protein